MVVFSALAALQPVHAARAPRPPAGIKPPVPVSGL